RDPVVDHDRRPAGQCDTESVTSKTSGSPFELYSLPLLDRGELVIGDTGECLDAVVDDAHAVFADSAHGELGLEGHSELPHDDDVEWSIERPSDLERDGHAPPAQAQHHDRLA